MTKQPYTYELLLSTISPSEKIAVYEIVEYVDSSLPGMEELYKGFAIRSKDNAELLSREIRHIGINEYNKLKDGARPLLEIIVY